MGRKVDRMKKAFHTEAYKRFTQLLIEARKLSKLTQTEVAEGLSRPQSYVSKYESGERRLDVIEFLQITQVLNCDPTEIFKKLEYK